MDITFSETFDKVIECFREPTIESQLTQHLQSITIIRDVLGKIRVFLEPVGALEDTAIANLHDSLAQKLGPYYGEDIWLPEGEQDGYKALIEVITSERVRADWDDGNKPDWYILERHIAKQAWTNKDAGNPPWRQDSVDRGYKPAVVAFFSFKGGVGRTTALVGTALTLARQGHRVAIIDLDLEAPGLSTIFFSDTSDMFGVIDYLLEKQIQNSNWRLRTHLLSINDKILLGDRGETLRLLPAGTVNEQYLEKLARLDFQNLVNNQVPETLGGMLKELQAAAKALDFILLDARAGFHDIGGLAIASLAHGAVIFGTQSRQSWAGLTHVIRRLARPQAPEPLPVLLCHAMAPGLGVPAREQELQDFRDRAYTVFQENYYHENDDIPNSNDPDAPFWPVVLDWQSTLRREIALFSENSSSESARAGIVSLLTGKPYEDIAERLCQMFGRELKKEVVA
ncbi:MAG: tyrosine-protein kinase family protein [Hormoscilla sp. SP5CHS1]|nr:tyrosine-protein kinase family protein [Hormoscilla sp. SP5CHS1]